MNSAWFKVAAFRAAVARVIQGQIDPQIALAIHAPFFSPYLKGLQKGSNALQKKLSFLGNHLCKRDGIRVKAFLAANKIGA